MNSSTTAIFGLVPFGAKVIEGYLLPDYLCTKLNRFGVSKTQAVILAYPTFDRNHAATKFTQIENSKKAQTIAPEGFRVHSKIKTDAGQSEAAVVDLLPADQLVPFLKLCKQLKSKAADEMIDDLAGLSIQQIFSDAFKLDFNQQDRQNFLFRWQMTRQMARNSHAGFTESCLKKHHPGNLVHDYITVLIFGDTAKAARMKALVSTELDLDPQIGLNHQEDIDGMLRIANAKTKYVRLKTGTWQEQAEKAVK